MNDQLMAQVSKLTHAVIVGAPRLLPMLYRPLELAEELSISHRSIRTWIKQGLPYQRDGRGHLWIDGRDFTAWVEAVQSTKKSRRTPMASDEAYCFRCHRPVALKNPSRKEDGKRVLLRGICPECGGSIFRGGCNGQS